MDTGEFHRVQTYEQFIGTRYWPQLDGLRTVSIALVFIIHMGDAWWIPYKGALAVVLFFVISGFLITTLLLREEQRNGRISLKSFYIRRLARIAPLYYIALVVSGVLAVGFGFGSGRENFLERLPLLATFNGDLAGNGTFVHSWSIGVEEKFYILWPIVGFALLILAKRRGLFLTILLPMVAVCAYMPAVTYIGMYTGIVAGCALAVAMHTRRGYRIVSRMATWRMAAIFLAIALFAFIFDWALPLRNESGLAHVPFALASAFLFPAIVIGRNWLASGLAWKPLVFLGTRTYGIYLFHPLCIDVVSRVIPAGQTEAWPSLLRLLMAALLACATAECLHRAVEGPMISLGRRLARKYASGPPSRLANKSPDGSTA